MKTGLSIFFFLICLTAYCQFSIKEIPDSLKENANEIVISDETTFIINNLSNSSQTRRLKALIMNNKADELTSWVLSYNDFRSIQFAEIRIIELNGKVKDRIKLKDFMDYSAKGSSMASDSRAKYYEVNENHYPYILEIEYKINLNGSLFYPTWTPQSVENRSVLRSTLKIESPDNQSFRYKSNGIEPSIQELDNSRILHIWEVNSLVAFEFESLSHTIEDYAPIVYTAPNQFIMDEYEGNLSSWEEFGHWINKLNSGKNTFTEEIKKDLRSAVAGMDNDLDKIKFIYSYLQQNTRYVSIQLGIGGWQPFESGFVHNNKYGDCKALSYYGMSLLNAIGIKSYYTLISAGTYASEPDPDFAANRFNHAILTVPVEGDTIWLECTSQTNPFGYLGTFTSDRNALMITEDGGRIVKTKSYTVEENLQSTYSKMDINENGVAEISFTRIYNGLEIENNGFEGATLKSSEDQRKWLYDRHNWGNVELKSIELKGPTQDIVPRGELVAELKIQNAAVSNSNRLFFKPFIFTNANNWGLNQSEREKPFEIRYPYSQVDSIDVTFPEIYFPESSLQDVSITTEFGTYERIVIQNENSFTFIRKFKLQKGLWDPGEYGEFRTFIKEVQKHDQSRIVMLNRT